MKYECFGHRVDMRGQVLTVGDVIDLDPTEAAVHIANDIPIRAVIEETAQAPVEETNDVTV